MAGLKESVQIVKLNMKCDWNVSGHRQAAQLARVCGLENPVQEYQAVS
jgi:hypothetical protein